MRNLVIAVVAAVVAQFAHAQGTFPQKPVRVIVPFAAGGATDVLARLVSSGLSERLGQPVIVENRTGANGQIGTEAVAKSPPDGYALLMGTIATHSIQPSLVKQLPYDSVKDFAPLIQVASQVYVVVAHPSFAPVNMQELAAAARRKPGQLSYASAARGTGAHLFAELFASMAGVEMTPLHYKGAAPAMNDVLGGHVPFTFDVLLTTLNYIKAGKLKVLAVTSERRSPVLPEVPGIAESGYPGYDAVGWNGLFAPAATPKDIVARLNAEVNAVLKVPEVRERITQQGAEVIGGSPEQFAGFIRAETVKWARVIRERNITPD